MRRNSKSKNTIHLDKLGSDWDSFLLALNKLSNTPFLSGEEECEICANVGALTFDSHDLNFFYYVKDAETGELSVAPTVYEICEIEVHGEYESWPPLQATVNSGADTRSRTTGSRLFPPDVAVSSMYTSVTIRKTRAFLKTKPFRYN
eukprot:g6524.t1